jgi:hypothetical protein
MHTVTYFASMMLLTSVKSAVRKQPLQTHFLTKNTFEFPAPAMSVKDFSLVIISILQVQLGA